MKMMRTVIYALGSFSIVTGLAVAVLREDSSVCSSSGVWCSNGTFRTVTCIAQPGTCAVSEDGRFTHYAGFLGGAFIDLSKTNSLGVPLEADPDNDDDSLADWDEVSGSAFGGFASSDPNISDTDGDGMSDADEAAGMYNPNDADSLLKILSMERNGGVVTVTWLGKGGGTVNALVSGKELSADSITNIVERRPYLLSGPHPWYTATNYHSFPVPVDTNLFYRVHTEN